MGTLGQKLAILHLNKNEFFGLDYDNYVGSLKQINKNEDNWKDFYSNHRILHLTKSAFNKELLTKADSKKINLLKIGHIYTLYKTITNPWRSMVWEFNF